VDIANFFIEQMKKMKDDITKKEKELIESGFI